MSGAVAVLLALVGFLLLVVGARGTYMDAVEVVLHAAASGGSEKAAISPSGDTGGSEKASGTLNDRSVVSGGGGHGGVR